MLGYKKYPLPAEVAAVVEEKHLKEPVAQLWALIHEDEVDSACVVQMLADNY